MLSIVTTTIRMTSVLTNICNHSSVEHTAPLALFASCSAERKRETKNPKDQESKQDHRHHATFQKREDHPPHRLGAMGLGVGGSPASYPVSAAGGTGVLCTA